MVAGDGPVPDLAPAIDRWLVLELADDRPEAEASTAGGSTTKGASPAELPLLLFSAISFARSGWSWSEGGSSSRDIISGEAAMTLSGPVVLLRRGVGSDAFFSGGCIGGSDVF
jgi:hypothetical protein